MIAELFYPKELKEVIADLRAKGELKDNATSYLNRECYMLVLVLLGFGALLYAGGTLNKWYWFLFYLFVIWSAIRVQYTTSTKKYVIPYTLGEQIQATIVGSNYNPVHSGGKGYWLKYKFSDSNNKTIFGKFGPIRNPFQGLTLKNSDQITVYVCRHNPNLNAPFIEDWQQNYCLNKNKQLSQISIEKGCSR